LHHAHRVLGGIDIAIADDRNLYRGLHLGDAAPVRLAAIPLLACARMERDGLQAAIFCEARHLKRHQLEVVPSGAELHGERNGNRLADFAQQAFHQRQIAQQTGAAIAFHYLVDGAAEVDVENVKAKIFANACGIGHDGGVGAEKLRRDRMLLRLEGQVFQSASGLARVARGADAMRARELGHDQPAATQVADEAAENRVGDAGHGRQHGGRLNGDGPDRKLSGELHHLDDFILMVWRPETELRAGPSDGERAEK